MSKRGTGGPEKRENSRTTSAWRVIRFDATVVGIFRRLFAEGTTYRQITVALQAAGHPPPGSRAYWQPTGWSHVAVMRIARQNRIL
ncbi:MAG: hypothetical protein OXF56_18540 [Rhodobacteraceae bacterium]|nr:hypothetical protein [Paracoccaceae bacterium]